MIVRDRIAQVTNTSGTGNLEINGTINGFRTFIGQIAAASDKVFAVLVKDGDAWELFESYIISGSPDQLFRGALISSSTGSRINLSNTANKPIYQVEPAEALGAMAGRSSFAVTAGTAPDYTAVFPVPIRAKKNGVRVTIFIHAVNPTANNTFAPDGLSSSPMKFGRPLRKIAAGKLPASLLVNLEYVEADDAWVVLSALPIGVTKTISGTTYTVLEEDHGTRLIFTSATAVAVTVPQATGQFAAPFEFTYTVAGAGTVTFTPTTSTVSSAAGDAATTLVATKGQGGGWYSDGGNYRSTQPLLGSTLGTVTKTANFTLTTAEFGKEINFTTAGATLTLLDPTTCADAVVTVRNSAASGDVTLGGFNVDGIASRKIRPGRRNVLHSDGTAWRTVSGAYYFETSGQTVTFSADLTVAHGLGVRPDSVLILLINVSAEANYAPGDPGIIFLVSANNSPSQGIHPRIDATNITILQSSSFAVLDKTARTFVNITPAKWSWTIIASVDK